MSLSPEQMRQKSEAMAESLRHARYAAVDRMGDGNGALPNSSAIAAAGRRVEAATAKEEADIGGQNASINADRY